MPMYWKRVRPLRAEETEGELSVYRFLGAVARQNGDEGLLLLIPTGKRPQTVRRIISRFDKEQWEQVHLCDSTIAAEPPIEDFLK